MNLNCAELDFRFYGHMRPPVVGSPDGTPWRKTITGIGPPTVQTAGNLMELALTATSEVQNVSLHWGDVLSIDIDDLQSIDIWARLSATFAAANKASFGLAAARNDDPDVITAAALFRISGNNNVLCETDDGVLDSGAIATGETLSGASLKHFRIDFQSGIQTVAPPGKSKGGKSAVQFSMEDARGVLRPVARNTLFDMSNYSGGLQPFFQVQKTVGVTTGTLGVRRVLINYREQP